MPATLKITVPDQNGNQQTFTLEIARTPEERQRGLMFRQHMASDHGMLFIQDKLDIHSFWMKNTYIPLDMVFLDAEFRIAGIIRFAQPLTTQSLSISKPSRYIIEFNAGTADRLGLQVGDTIRLPL